MHCERSSLKNGVVTVLLLYGARYSIVFIFSPLSVLHTSLYIGYTLNGLLDTYLVWFRLSDCVSDFTISVFLSFRTYITTTYTASKNSWKFLHPNYRTSITTTYYLINKHVRVCSGYLCHWQSVGHHIVALRHIKCHFISTTIADTGYLHFLTIGKWSYFKFKHCIQFLLQQDFSSLLFPRSFYTCCTRRLTICMYLIMSVNFLLLHFYYSICDYSSRPLNLSLMCWECVAVGNESNDRVC